MATEANEDPLAAQIRVRKQDSTLETVSIGEAFRGYVDLAHPDWNTSLITTGFEFDTSRLKGKEGFLAEAKKLVQDPKNMVPEKWVQDVSAGDSEYRVIKMLERVFASEAATIISGYKVSSLGDIINCLNNMEKELADSEFDVFVVIKVCSEICLLS